MAENSREPATRNKTSGHRRPPLPLRPTPSTAPAPSASASAPAPPSAPRPGNLLIKLTSLRRIRRLESVWDDDMRFADAARNRAAVARRLLHDCDPRSTAGGRPNRLIRAGYGGWLLYFCF
ncbi:hypothetical protein GUJ93_ZPchr0004g38209 [Zizania palustris]|uniref:Uncharacterized protein n=1 Tax=Zizania palustris TaxID=103762 RepID=A0A8J5SYH6_ZIZPA|nr:hypothetical protein GUJ93_ZPchr0004g38209 [Zizania palustris]